MNNKEEVAYVGGLSPILSVRVGKRWGDGPVGHPTSATPAIVASAHFSVGLLQS